MFFAHYPDESTLASSVRIGELPVALTYKPSAIYTGEVSGTHEIP